MAEQETYGAKQVARRIGTDAKTFRKWLRSPASPYDAVGQGKRYEFPRADLPEIKKQFNAWKNKKPNGTVSAKVTTTVIPTPEVDDKKRRIIEERRVENRDGKLNDMDDEEMLEYLESEPTAEELEDLELDLDLEDL